jgi:hypothetical protein
MNKLLAVLVLCLPVFGQAKYSGSDLRSGAGIFFGSGSGCAAPTFCAYTGVDVIPWGTVPNLSATNGVQNNATVYDTSFLGHLNIDGITTFSNSAYLSPVTRVTDAVSAAGSTRPNFTAGIGGSAAFVLTGLSLTGGGWVRIDKSTAGMVCLFNATAYPGHCQPASAYANTGSNNPGSGIFLTTNMCNAASGCFSGTSGQVQDFGQLTFSLTDANTFFTFGGNLYDITASTIAATGVTPYTLSRTAGSVGVYSMHPTIVDFQYGIPAGNNAPEWATSTSYAYGAYVSHTLTSAEMLNGGVWAQSLAVVPGDIIRAGVCMYRAIVGGTTLGSGTGPAFLASACKAQNTYTDGTVSWRGTNSDVSFIYQNVTSGTHTSKGSTFQWIATPATLTTIGSIASGSATLTVASGTPFAATQVGQATSVSGAGPSGGTLYATILAYNSATSVTLSFNALTTVSASATVALTGHPDFLSSTVGDSNGLAWVNVGPNYVPQNGAQMWSAVGGTSRDTLYPGASWPRYYSIGASTNSYGTASATTSSGSTGYNKYTADQGSGVWAIEYDAVSNIYHLLNTATGIWSDWSCSGGTGYNCSGGTWGATTIGSLVAITNPLGTGQPCPYYIHNAKMAKNGLSMVITMQSQYYPTACNSLQNFYLWKPVTANYSASATTGSLQITYAGMNHWDIGTNKLVAFNGSGFTLGSCVSPNCYTGGVFNTVYDLTGNVSASTDLTFGMSLNSYFGGTQRLANTGTAQSTPNGCYVTNGSDTSANQQNPDCNLSEVLDSHLSLAGDPGTDTYPACGTTYNYATLGPATNAFQNMETCYSTYPSDPASSLPETKGNAWQFTHTFATGTSKTFSTQFQISEYSQDANWLFWSSDWNCQTGSTTGVAPAVWTSGTYVDMLAVTAVPANASSICGLPWAANTTYVVGNMIDPIEGTGGSGAVDDVFQAIYVGGPTGATQPGPATPNSYFSTSVGPTTTAPGNTICDSASGASMNPLAPYSTSCTAGTVWQDIGPQNQRGDVFAVNLGLN